MPNVPSEKDQFWFRSGLFEIQAGEDKETNPLCYGRHLANWLASALRNEGVTVEEVFPEDWGWCVLVHKTPFRLWVGCGSVYDEQQLHDQLPNGADVVWTCIVVAEVPLMKRLFRTQDTAPDVANLLMRVKRLLTSDPSTTLVEEP